MWLLLHKKRKQNKTPVSEIPQRASLSIPRAYAHMLYCLLSACFLADFPVSLFFHTMMNDVYHLIAVHEIIWFIVFTLGVTMLNLYCRLISTQWSSPQFLRIFFFHSLCHNQLSRIFHIHSDKHSHRWSFFYLVLQSVPSTQTQKWKFWGAVNW